MIEADRQGMAGYYYYDFDQTSDSSQNAIYIVRFKVDSRRYGIDEETFDRLVFVGAGDTTALPGEDFGGVIVRRKYDRTQRGLRPAFMDAVGITREARMKRVISNRRRTTNPITSAANEAAGGENQGLS
jgi:hypothetical protein